MSISLPSPQEGDSHRVLLLTSSGEWAPLAIFCIPGDEPLICIQTRARADVAAPNEWQRSATAALRYGGGSVHARRLAHGLLGGPWRVDICPARAGFASNPFDAAALLRSEGVTEVPLPSSNDPLWRTTAVLCIPRGALLSNGAVAVEEQGNTSTPSWMFRGYSEGSSGNGWGSTTALVLAPQNSQSAAPLFALLRAIIQHASDLKVGMDLNWIPSYVCRASD